MKILVTGASGFLGSHITSALLEDGHEIVALLRRHSDLWRLSGLLERLVVVPTEGGSLETSLGNLGPFDAIVHAATCYGKHSETAADIVKANLLLPLIIMEQAPLAESCNFLNFDTFFCKHPDYSYLKEYTLSKSQFLAWGRVLAGRRRLRFTNLRLEHVFGPYDSENKFVTDLIRNCLFDVPAIELTPGMQRRDFVYVSDVVAAVLCLLNKAHDSKTACQEYEVGTGCSVPVRDFIDAVGKLTATKTVFKYGALEQRKGEVMESHADTEALRKLGWKPQMDWRKGLQATIEEARQRFRRQGGPGAN